MGFAFPVSRHSSARACLIVAAAAFVVAHEARGQDYFPAMMPDEMKLRDVPFPGAAVQAPEPVAAPAPVTVNVGPQPQTSAPGAAASSSPATFSQQQMEYLKNNIKQLEPSQATQAPAQPQSGGTIFIGSQVTGFLPPQPASPQHIIGSSQSTLQQIINAKPTQIFIGTAETAGSVVARTIVGPPGTALTVLGTTKSGLEAVNAYKTGGFPELANNALGSYFVDRSISAGMKLGAANALQSGLAQGVVSGPAVATTAVGYGAAAGATAYLSYEFGKKFVAPIVAPKIADVLVSVDKKYGLTPDGRALQQAEKQITALQKQLDAQHAKPDLRSFGVTQKDIHTAKQASLGSASVPTKSDFADAPGKPKNAVAPQPKPEPAAAPTRPATYNPTPRYQQYRQPQVNCAQLQQQLYAYAHSGALGALCQIEDQLARYCGGPRGNFCGGGGMGSFGGFVLPF